MALAPVSLNEYYVFLASPGDMASEREVVRKFFKDWNQIEGKAYDVRLEIIDWENYSSTGIGRPQEIITKQTLERFRNSLILVIGIMGQRFGTPTGESESGTEEEFKWALENWRNTGFPEVKFYFKNIKNFMATSNVNEIKFALEQYEKVQDFKNLCENGFPQLFYKTFDESEFTYVLANDLRIWLHYHERPWIKPRLENKSNLQRLKDDNQGHLLALKNNNYGAKKLREIIMPNKAFTEKATQIRMLWVPKGRYQIGLGRKEDAPWINISPFWIGETPITNQQYRLFVNNSGYDEPSSWSDPRFSDPQQPVVCVSWNDAMAFCKWLSEITELKWSIPSESQWEYAARGNDGRIYPWGNEEPTPELACYGLDKDTGCPPLLGIFIKGRGPFGTFDQAGAVWEWCQDIWNENTYKQWIDKEFDDPINLSGEEDYKILRGGCWADPPKLLKMYVRYMRQEDYKYVRVGFRVALNLKDIDRL